MEKLSFEQYVEVMEKRVPLHNFLGIKLLDYQKDYARIAVPFRPEFLGNFIHGFWHGGISAAVMDAIGGIAADSHFYPQSAVGRLATIDLRIDYIRPVQKRAIIAEGRVIRAGNKTMLVKMRLFHEDAPSEILVEGRGVWNIR
ncbi:MAG: hotdog fold thioesterase [Bacteroidetes bacterium]|nr:MAG: hotdog fold thioesterase [Bacteroidota bacterium]